MIAELPDELLDAIAEAWSAGNRERAESLMETVAEYHRANWMTREAVLYLLSKPELLSRIRRSSVDRTHTAREELDTSIAKAVHDVISEDLWEDADNDTFAGQVLTYLADGVPEIDCDLVARVLFFRLRAMVIADAAKRGIREVSVANNS